jgi:PKD repeat protein
VYTAPLTGTSATVQATRGVVNGSTTLAITNQPPLVASSIGVTLTPASATTANLSVTGVDDSGQSNLTYAWAAVGTPPEPISFSVNGTNAAQNTVATFNAIGNYTLQVTIADPGGLTTTTTTSSVMISTIVGTAGNDTIRLVRSGANLMVYNNAASYAVPYASLGTITIAGGAGVDSVNLDFSGGASPVPAAGITVDGTGGNDTLTITGTTAADTSTITANTIAFDASQISYSNIASIAMNGNGGADSLTQTAQPGNAAALSFSAGTGNTLNVSSGTYTFAAAAGGSGTTSLPFASRLVGSGA